MPSWPKDTSSPSELANICKAVMPQCQCLEVPVSDEDVAEKYLALITELLLWTPRLNVTTMTEAFKMACKAEDADALRMARSIGDVVSACRQKAKSMTSGKKCLLP